VRTGGNAAAFRPTREQGLVQARFFGGRSEATARLLPSAKRATQGTTICGLINEQHRRHGHPLGVMIRKIRLAAVRQFNNLLTILRDLGLHYAA
jgi:hypothetical protein